MHLIEYAEYEETFMNLQKSIVFIVMAYGVGFLTMILPGFYMEYLGFKNVVSDVCLGSNIIK